ncbi:ABC transporter permease [Candidatus Venteria ishoeyi]|uniref:ABC transporter permease n=1 Tax=Candidatus Venteria ishoeyi TaxID=1899563 RepID=UPI0025A609B9|nr:ABC transporter permease [Candidatus Venteria ishoeyi]MDM8545620.1 ABC transporter permease [Candidatus Venteria ishoeyi]
MSNPLPPILSWPRSWFFATKNGLIEPLQYAFAHYSLLWMLAKRDIAGRTSGTVLGAGWLILQPGLQLLGFWFLMDMVLQIRFPGRVSFVEYFIVGMLTWFFIADVLSRSLTVFQEYASLYQRALFPLAILPLIPLLMSGLIYTLVNVITATLMIGPAAAPLALFNMLVLMLWLIPLVYLLAVIGIFLKDLGQIFPFFITLTMYLTPILYKPDMMPDAMQWVLVINPFADIMSLIHGGLQDMTWNGYHILRPVILWLLLLGPAWMLFRRAEPHVREML